MSELAYSRFIASYMLTAEEQLPENKGETLAYTEDVLQAVFSTSNHRKQNVLIFMTLQVVGFYSLQLK